MGTYSNTCLCLRCTARLLLISSMGVCVCVGAAFRDDQDIPSLSPVDLIQKCIQQLTSASSRSCLYLTPFLTFFIQNVASFDARELYPFPLLPHLYHICARPDRSISRHYLRRKEPRKSYCLSSTRYLPRHFRCSRSRP